MFGTIIYCLLKPERYEEAVKLALNVYLRQERACQLLNVKSFPDHDKYAENYFHRLADQSCSYVAINEANNELVGVLFNSEVDRNKVNGLSKDECGNEEWAKLLAVYKQNKASIPNLFNHFNVEKYFYLGYLSVRPDFCSRGVGASLLRQCEDFLKSKGHGLAVADVTADQTKHICISKMGFNVLGEMKYKDFIWKGKKILAHVNEKENLKFVAKTYSGTSIKKL
ncbi:uncharacterized protein LOC136029178 [Artemia franciscana]|uniref:uncharacterized protein LOC136029178 n=1 Tax=Artemia franciscana TaxID=6661 RepID=UPI0032DB2F5F